MQRISWLGQTNTGKYDGQVKLVIRYATFFIQAPIKLFEMLEAARRVG
ncbi:MAG: hypothetical protein Q9N62_01805 [Ghiorsea sp.]|nr:hypothetical protein [Ghiorsea sp.]